MNGNTTVAGHNLSSGTVINLLTALPDGANTFKIASADKVGNKSWAIVTFTIIVTPQSIINDVKQFQASHAISGLFAPLLLSYLESAQAAYNAGKCGAADSNYSTFISTVQILEGMNAISHSTGSVLIADAQYLMANCP